MPRVCPNCRLVHPNGATRCDCGRDLTRAAIVADDRPPKPLRGSTVSARQARTGAHVVALGALALLGAFPPWVVSQQVTVDFRYDGEGEGPHGGTAYVSREAAQLGHRWLWAFEGQRPISQSLSGLAVEPDWRLLGAEGGAIVGTWALALALIPARRQEDGNRPPATPA